MASFQIEWTDPLLLAVDRAGETGELRKLHREIPLRAEEMLREGISPAEITCRVSGWHDRIARRVLQLSEERLRREGADELPRYCWLVLGSGGREEATFWTDQDNALVYETGALSAAEAGDTVSRLAAGVVTGLKEAGYPLCEGNVMATNPRWRGTSGEWEERLALWTRDPQLDHARYAIMASDARPVGGDEELYRQWRARFQSLLRANPAVLIKEAQRPSHRRVPLGPFRRLYTETHGNHAGKVDIKEGGYLQLVESVRLWALRLEAEPTSTRERIGAIASRLGWPDGKTGAALAALDAFLRWRLIIHAGLEDGLDKNADNHLDPGSLGKEELSALKEAMQTAASLRKEVHRSGGNWSGQTG